MKAINEKTRKTVALEVYFPTFAVQGQPAALMADELDPDEIDALIAQQAAEAAGDAAAIEAEIDAEIDAAIVTEPQPGEERRRRRSRPTTSPS